MRCNMTGKSCVLCLGIPRDGVCVLQCFSPYKPDKIWLLSQSTKAVLFLPPALFWGPAVRWQHLLLHWGNVFLLSNSAENMTSRITWDLGNITNACFAFWCSTTALLASCFFLMIQWRLWRPKASTCMTRREDNTWTASTTLLTVSSSPVIWYCIFLSRTRNNQCSLPLFPGVRVRGYLTEQAEEGLLEPTAWAITVHIWIMMLSRLASVLFSQKGII